MIGPAFGSTLTGSTGWGGGNCSGSRAGGGTGSDWTAGNSKPGALRSIRCFSVRGQSFGPLFAAHYLQTLYTGLIVLNPVTTGVDGVSRLSDTSMDGPLKTAEIERLRKALGA